MLNPVTHEAQQQGLVSIIQLDRGSAIGKPCRLRYISSWWEQSWLYDEEIFGPSTATTGSLVIHLHNILTDFVFKPK